MTDGLPNGGIELADAELDRLWATSWHPREVAARLAAISTPWYVAAGWALDLFRGEQTRKHDDIEIAVPAAHFPAIRDRFDGYFTLMSNPKILDAVESLIGPEIFSNPVYNVRPKVPKVAAGAVPWHQDKSYWPDANSNPVITVWIPLVDSTHENGCLHLIPGTHRRRVINYHFEKHTGTGYTETDLEVVARESKKREIVALPVLDCWNSIGVKGDRSCPKLRDAIHCHNCEVFANAARTFLDRPAPDGYLAEVTGSFARATESKTAQAVSVVLFEVGDQLLAIDADDIQLSELTP